MASGKGGKPEKSESPVPPSDRAKLQAVGGMFAVLADPSRLAILNLLRAGPLTVTEIVERLTLRQAAVSKHLSVLYAAAFVDRQRIGNHVRYWITEPMIFDLCDLVCAKLQRDATKFLETLQ